MSIKTDAQKVEALTALLSDAIHSLEMTKYEIENVSEAAYAERKADEYFQQMLDILHGEATSETVY